MSNPKAIVHLISMHHERLDDEPAFRLDPYYWDHFEDEVVKHLDEALELEANNPECHETLAHEIIYEFNLLASYMKEERILSIADDEPDTSWDREIAHQAGMGGLSATDYAGEES